MLGTQNQLRNDFEAELLIAANIAPSIGPHIYTRDERGFYLERWVENQWLGYLLGRAHDAKE